MQNIALALIITILAALSVFQIALAAGYPLGEYAWGGQHKLLPRNLRIASLFSVLIYAFIVSIIVDRAGVLDFYSTGFLNDSAIWVIVVYFGLGILMNAISRSKKERNAMTPVVLVLFLATLFIATST